MEFFGNDGKKMGQNDLFGDKNHRNHTKTSLYAAQATKYPCLGAHNKKESKKNPPKNTKSS
jgi:hypothetical protein